MASSVTVHIVNMRKILLPEAKPRLTGFTRVLTICTVTLEAMQYLFYYTEQKVTLLFEMTSCMCITNILTRVPCNSILLIGQKRTVSMKQ